MKPVLLALLAATAGPAAAATHVVTLTGNVATQTSNSFTFTIPTGPFAGIHTLTQTQLLLSGFDPFEIDDGDSIEFSLTFEDDGTFTVGAAVAGPFGQLMGIDFGREDSADPVDASNGGGTVTLDSPVGDLAGFSLAGGCGNCLSVILGRGGPGPWGPVAFKGLSGFTVVGLGAPYTVDRILLSTQLQTGYQPLAAIPEPATWALLIAGFGLVGATARRRRTAVEPASASA